MKTLIVIGLAMGLAGCVASGPSQLETTVAGQRARWFKCLQSAYESARASKIEKHLAAEQSFVACNTEEQALFSHFYDTPELALSAIQTRANLKAKLKAEMVGSPV